MQRSGVRSPRRPPTTSVLPLSSPRLWPENPSFTKSRKGDKGDANVSPASDIDLYVYKGGTFVGGSGSGTSAEEVNLVNPAAGNDYIVYVHGFGVPGTANFRLFSWLLGSTSEPNMAISAPTTATLGATGTINLSFSGLAPGNEVPRLGGVLRRRRHAESNDRARRPVGCAGPI